MDTFFLTAQLLGWRIAPARKKVFTVRPRRFLFPRPTPAVRAATPSNLPLITRATYLRQIRLSHFQPSEDPIPRRSIGDCRSFSGVLSMSRLRDAQQAQAAVLFGLTERCRFHPAE